jgi:uncharacterized protein (TIGR02284 family)
MAEDKDLHRDPVSVDNESHPVGTGVGAVGGAIAGAAAGTVGGPAGMVVGGVVGAVVGGLAGRAAAEAIDPKVEEAHWRENYNREPYYGQGRSYDDYAPAYRLGMTGRSRYDQWDAAEPQLASEWETTRGTSGLDWDTAKPASRAAWERVDSSMRGGAMATAGTADVTGMGHANDLGLSQTQRMSTAESSTSSDRDVARGGAAAAVGAAQSAGNMSGDRDDVIDVLQDLAECSLDGEYGFRACAEHAKREDLKSMFLQRADDCRNGWMEMNEQILSLGGKVEEHGSATGAVHRGWVAVKSALSTYDDKAILEEAERGEDNAKARYAKALKSPLPANVKLVVERQMQGVQRNHDQIKRLRDEFRAMR